MRILTYSETPEQSSQIQSFIKTFSPTAPHISFQGTEGFNMFFQYLQKEDTVIFTTLNGIFAHVESFLMFIRFCKSQDIRLISLDDSIDSSDELFPLPCASQLLTVLCQLKASKTPEIANDAESDLFSQTGHDRMLKRHRMVINLYTANYSIKDILRLSGYKSKKTIYLILTHYNIPIAYPSMCRHQQAQKKTATHTPHHDV